MADHSVSVVFGGNSSELEAAIAKSTAAMRQAGAEVSKLAREMAKAGETADAEMGAKLLAASEKFSAAKVQLQGFRDQLKGLESGAGGLKNVASAMEGLGAAGHGAGLGFFIREFHALGDEISSGRYRQAEGTFANLAVTFLQSNAALIPYVAAAAAAAAAIGLLAYKAYEAQAAVSGLRLDAAVNQFQMSAEAAATLRDEIEKLGGVSASNAEAIAKPFLQLGAVGGTIAEMLAPAMKQLAASMGDDVGGAAKELAERFIKLDTAGLQYVEASRSMTQAQKDHFAALVATGQRMQAYAALVDVSTRSLATLRNETTLAAAEERDHARAAQLAASAGYSLADASHMIESASAQAKAGIQAETEAVNAHRIALLAASSAAENFASGMQAAFKVDSVGAGIKQTADEISRLQAGLAAAPDHVTAAATEMSRALDIAKDKMRTLLQQQGDPANLGRNLTQQVQDQVEHLNNTWRGSTAARLQAEVQMNRAILANDNATNAEKAAAQKNVESLTKQLYDSQAKSGVKAAHDVLGAQLASIQGQIRAQQELARATLDHAQAEVKLKIITPSAGESASIDALKKEQAAVDALYAKQLALAGLTATKKQELANQEVAFNDQVALKIQEAQEKAAEAAQKSWDSAMKQVNSAFDSQISGLLKGTESWRTAMKNAAASVTEDLIKAGVNKMLTGGENMLGGLFGMGPNAAGAAGSPAMRANTSALTALNGQLAALLGVLGVHTGATVANTGASLANTGASGINTTAHAVTATSLIGNTLSTLANTVATEAAAIAHVLGFATGTPMVQQSGLAVIHQGEAIVPAAMNPFKGLASFDIGAWSVPQDMLSMVHHNELVMPAGEAGAFRNMLSAAAGGRSGGGGGDTHFHGPINIHPGQGQQMDGAKAYRQLMHEGRRQGMRFSSTDRAKAGVR
jgi:hypothetical protein